MKCGDHELSTTCPATASDSAVNRAGSKAAGRHLRVVAWVLAFDGLEGLAGGEHHAHKESQHPAAGQGWRREGQARGGGGGGAATQLPHDRLRAAAALVT